MINGIAAACWIMYAFTIIISDVRVTRMNVLMPTITLIIISLIKFIEELKDD